MSRTMKAAAILPATPLLRATARPRPAAPVLPSKAASVPRGIIIAANVRPATSVPKAANAPLVKVDSNAAPDMAIARLVATGATVAIAEAPAIAAAGLPGMTEAARHAKARAPDAKAEIATAPVPKA